MLREYTRQSGAELPAAMLQRVQAASAILPDLLRGLEHLPRCHSCRRSAPAAAVAAVAIPILLPREGSKKSSREASERSRTMLLLLALLLVAAAVSVIVLAALAEAVEGSLEH